MSRWVVAAGLLCAAVPGCGGLFDGGPQYTVRGWLADETGAPAGEVDVRLYKVPTFRWRGDLLHHTDIDQYPGITQVVTVKTTTTGTFAIELSEAQVLDSDGRTPASLAVVYFSGGLKNAYLAVASEWFALTEVDPVFDAGTLKLWDGGEATQIDDDVVFDWSALAMPSGQNRDMAKPYFLFVYAPSNPDRVWVDHTFATQLSMPRAAFDDTVGAATAEYCIVGYSQTAAGGREHSHRTSLRNQHNQPVSNWQSVGFADNYLRDGTSGANLYGHDGSLFSDGKAADGGFDHPSESHFFVGQPAEFFINLGGERPYTSIVVHNLGVTNLYEAQVSFARSALTSADPTTINDWVSLGPAHAGDVEFVGSVYLGYTAAASDPGCEQGSGLGAVCNGQWLRVRVDKATGQDMPFLEFVGEVAVKY